MKIGILTQRHILGFGVDLVVHKTAQFLSNFGHDVTVLANVASEDFPCINYKVVSIPVELHPAPKKEFYNGHLYQKYISSFHFDVLIIHTLPFLYALPKFTTVPTVVIEHGTSDTLFFPLHTKIFFHLNEYFTYNYYYSHADMFFSISEFLKKKLPENLQKKTVIIPHGVDHYAGSTYAKEEVLKQRRQLGIADDSKVLLYVGRLNYEKQPYKNTRNLLNIYRELKISNPGIQLVMVGFGDDEDRVYLEQKGVIPVVNAPYDKMSLYFQMCDIFVTATRWEGFDLPLLEAQYFGKPVVAYAIGAHPEVCLNNKTGFLVTSSQEFKKKIAVLANNALIYKYMSVNARNFAQEFTWEKAARSYERHLYSLLASRSTSLPSSSKDNSVKKSPFISIIIPNYNGSEQMLEDCLKSIHAQTFADYEIILVDNNSKDKNYYQLCEKYKDTLRLIENTRNLGFSGAINKGIEKARGEWLFLLNFDTYLSPYCLENFVKNLPDDYTNIAGYAPKMYLAHEYRVFDSLGTGLNKYTEAFNVGIGEIDVGQYDRSRAVCGACFGAAFLQKKAFEYIGMLDESYGMYYEDVDWCLRANLLGFSFYTLPSSRIYHYHSASLRHLSYNWKYEFIELNLLKTSYKNYSFKNFSRTLLKRLRGYYGQKKKNNTLFLKNNYNIVKRFNQQMKVLSKQRDIIQKRKITTEDKVIHLSSPPKDFFDPQLYSCKYTTSNLLSGLEEKMKSSLLGSTDYKVWTLLKAVHQGELDLCKAKECFVNECQNGIYQKMLFNLLPDHYPLHPPLYFAPNRKFQQTHEHFPSGLLEGISLWIQNHNGKNSGNILCELFSDNDYIFKNLALPEVIQDLWLHFPFQINIVSAPIVIRFSFRGNGRMVNVPSPGLSESPLYPFTSTTVNNDPLSGNLVIKYHFSPEERS